jgi:hypothetical protein
MHRYASLPLSLAFFAKESTSTGPSIHDVASNDVLARPITSSETLESDDIMGKTASAGASRK